MDLNNLRLICLHDTENDLYTVYPDKLKGLVVQVDKLEDAPRELAKSFEVMMKLALESEDTYDVMTYDSNDFIEM